MLKGLLREKNRLDNLFLRTRDSRPPRVKPVPDVI